VTIQLDGYNVRKTQTLEDLGVGVSDVVGSVAEQAWIYSPTSSLTRLNELSAATNETVMVEEIGEPVGPMADLGVNFAPQPDFVFKDRRRKGITKEEADKKISEAGVDLKIGPEGIPDGALDIMIARKREEVKRQAIISSAPAGFWSGAAQIGVGLAVSIADPLNVASAFIPIMGPARYTGLIANATSGVARAGIRAKVGAASGLVGAAVVEPLVLSAATQEQAEYGLYDSFLNLTFGAVLGGGLHTGLGAIGDVISRSSASSQQDMLSAAVAQAMRDEPIDVGFIARLDESFQTEWKRNQVARAIEGSEVDPVILAEFKSFFREIEPTLRARAKDLEPEAAARAADDLDNGRIPEPYISEVTGLMSSRISAFDSPPPLIDIQPPEPARISSQEATASIENRAGESLEDVDAVTNDIIGTLDASNPEVTALINEIDEINLNTDREAAGVREAFLCMTGK
jgi:hypothetical protein